MPGCAECRALGVRRLDVSQGVLLAVCVFDLCFFCVYLAEYGAPTQSTISDTLFHHPEYKAALTCFLLVRVVGAGLFIWRFRRQCPEMEVLGVMGILIAFAGWLLLISVKETLGHFLGVGVFCVGSFAYSFALIRLAATNPNDRQELETLRSGLEWFLLLAVVALVIAFASLWLEEQSDEKGAFHEGRMRKAFIVEHAAYMAHLVFYVVFFLYHSPDPYLSHKAYYARDKEPEPYVVVTVPEQEEAVNAGVDGTPMQCRPLLPNHAGESAKKKGRLPVIMEVIAR